MKKFSKDERVKAHSKVHKYEAETDDILKDDGAASKKVKGKYADEGFGNTLDYYNDDMPIKAASKLYDSVKNGKTKAGAAQDDEEIVKGYEDEYEEDIAEPPVPVPETLAEDQPVSESKVIRDMDHQESADAADPPEKEEDKPAEKQASARHADRYHKDDQPYDFSRYRRERERNVTKPSPRKPVRTASAVRKPLAAPVSNPDKPAVPATGALPLRPERRRRETALLLDSDTGRNNFETDDGFEYDAPPQTELFKIVPIVGVILLLIITAVLVYQLEAAKAELNTAKEELRVQTNSGLDVNELRLEIERLEEEKIALQNQIDEKAYLAVEAPQETTPADGGEQPEPTPEPAQANTGGERYYEVVSGDNLSKISSEFYGNAMEYMRIVEANNLEQDARGNYLIYPGATLIIP
ncbi:MAG: LysM peptidoglycan-binding domain-containing protein [Clostridiales bacterium]|jgi:hypothetical protein|nr:LysM peptidoglycan-binding domain-containing protein [Clostridiales bacterium]